MSDEDMEQVVAFLVATVGCVAVLGAGTMLYFALVAIGQFVR